MLEVHTQVYGTGRMQKFHENDFKSLYEEVMMAPGFTHDPFTGVKNNGDLFYGWHQYYSDTDCIWMAIEYHPAWNSNFKSGQKIFYPFHCNIVSIVM